MYKLSQSSFGGSEENPVDPSNWVSDIAPGQMGIGGNMAPSPAQDSKVLLKAQKMDEKRNVALHKKHLALSTKVAHIIENETNKTAAKIPTWMRKKQIKNIHSKATKNLKTVYDKRIGDTVKVPQKPKSAARKRAEQLGLVKKSMDKQAVLKSIKGFMKRMSEPSRADRALEEMRKVVKRKKLKVQINKNIAR